VLQAYRDLWANERILNVIEQLIGPDIAASPVWNLRTKTPNNEATVVPWHQGIVLTNTYIHTQTTIPVHLLKLHFSPYSFKNIKH
jgi:hypothetical protein